MVKQVAIGIQEFDTLRERDCFYIDKTAFIKDWWECGDEVTLITRPHQFGKTLNMSMIEQFFSINYAERSDLFKDLYIWNKKKYQDLQGTYPVISLTFAGIKEPTYEQAKLRIYQLIIEIYNKHSFLLNSQLLSEYEKKHFTAVSMEMSEVTATFAIEKMANYLYRYYGKKAIILLDAYDDPIKEAYKNGYQKEFMQFIRSMFNHPFKGNNYLSRGIITGITLVQEETILSDLNMAISTVTCDKYPSYFGFTEKETTTVLEEYELGDKKELIKNWYGGFSFGAHKNIYNPWSIINFLREQKINTFWTNANNNGFTSNLLKESSIQAKINFEKLLKNELFLYPLKESVNYNYLNSNESELWAYLVANGYLKIVSFETWNQISDEAEPQYELAFTNHEMARMFYKFIRNWFMITNTSYKCFVKAMLLGDLDTMNEYMNRITLRTFDHFGTQRKEWMETEHFYHGFVLRLFIELEDRYIITSNYESGFQKYDVMLIPQNKEDDAFILEFRIHDSEKEKKLTDTISAAHIHIQIQEKQYEAALIKKGIQKELIRKYGFAFEGKHVLIG